MRRWRGGHGTPARPACAHCIPRDPAAAYAVTRRRVDPVFALRRLPSGPTHDLLSSNNKYGVNDRPDLTMDVRTMSESDKSAVDAALKANPLAIAEAEGHLKKGLLILSQEIGLTATSNIVSDILVRLHGDLPLGRLH